MIQNECRVFPICLLIAAVLLALGSAPGRAASADSGGAAVQNGVDVLIADDFAPLAGKRIGLITNPTGVTRDLRSTIDVLAGSKKVKLVALFGLEHGVRGNVHAGDKIADSRDPATGLPVHSLYGKTQKPTREMLAGIDALVYDVQDIGVRSYTYVSSMSLGMEAAAENRIPFVVLDRPNPLTGNRIEGRPLDLKFSSMVGKFPVPYIYGMTCGELAKMINGEGWLAGGAKCDLTVVPLKGWRREMWFDQTGLLWVPTSPHIPRADTSMFYAATGIMGELHVVSEGVGYTLPFELAGGPFVEDAGAFANELFRRELPGVRFRPTYFTPYYMDHVKGKACGGVQLYITDRDKMDLTAVQFHAMDAVAKLYPKVKLFGSKRDDMFDKVCGTDQIRKMFLAGKSADEIVRFWNSGREAFMKQRARYLMYK